MGKLLRGTGGLRNDIILGADCQSETCNFRSDHDVRRSIETAPEILVIQLRRFEWDQDQGQTKNNAEISFPTTLRLTTFSSRGEPLRYELKSVAHHRGTLQSGHYINFARGPHQAWSVLDDERSASATLAEAKGNGKDGFTPYILFYQCLDDADIKRPDLPIAAADESAAGGNSYKRFWESINNDLQAADRALKRRRRG